MIHTGPVPGTFTSEWKPSPQRCHHCGKSGDVEYRDWESSDGAFEDTQYQCQRCGKRWWVEGPDA
jgi:transposase